MKKSYKPRSMNWDFPPSKQELELLRYFKNWIEKNVGKRCKKMGAGCCVCRWWALFDYIHLI